MISLKTELTPEEQHKKDLERLEQMRPMDDDLMRAIFRNNIPLAQFVLRIMTGNNDLVITSEETQYDLEHLLGARSICLDVLATDSKGRKFNLEIQRSDRGASPQRARYHSSAIDVEFLKANQDFSKLPITYVIFITEKDVRGANRPIYLFDRQDTITGEPFGDDEHIIFVNGAYNNPDDNSDLAKLIHDFGCRNDEDMYFDIMAESTHFYKKTEKGVSHMCRLMEEMRNDQKVIFAIKLLKRGKESLEEIAEDSGLSLDDVKDLAVQLNIISA